MTITGNLQPSASSPLRIVPTGAPFRMPNTQARFNQGFVNGYTGNTRPTTADRRREAMGVAGVVGAQLERDVLIGLATPLVLSGAAAAAPYAGPLFLTYSGRAALWRVGERIGKNIDELDFEGSIPKYKPQRDIQPPSISQPYRPLNPP